MGLRGNLWCFLPGGLCEHPKQSFDPSWAGWLHKCPQSIMRCPMATIQTMALSDSASLKACLIPPMSRFGGVVGTDLGWGLAGVLKS